MSEPEKAAGNVWLRWSDVPAEMREVVLWSLHDAAADIVQDAHETVIMDLSLVSQRQEGLFNAHQLAIDVLENAAKIEPAEGPLPSCEQLKTAIERLDGVNGVDVEFNCGRYTITITAMSEHYDGRAVWDIVSGLATCRRISVRVVQDVA